MDDDATTLAFTGRAAYDVDHLHPTGKIIVAARCRLASQPVVELALLDTGACWTLIPTELADEISNELVPTGELVSLSTRLGQYEGELHRLRVTLVADEGSDLSVEATVFVPVGDSAWHGPLVLGYRGCLDRICFALSPAMNAGGISRWFFAGTDGDAA